VPVHVIDTAGIRGDHHAQDEVERIGIARTWAEIEGADAVLFLHDLTRLGEPAYDTADADIESRLPRGAAHRVISVRCDCVDHHHAPCERLGHAACLARIEPAQVARLVGERLAESQTNRLASPNCPGT